MMTFIKSHRGWVVLIIVAVGVVFISYGPIIESLLNLTQGPTPVVTPDVSSWRSYTNAKFGVSLKYPLTFQLKPGQTGPLAEWELYGLTSGNEIASIEIPRSVQPRTNFGGASLRMGLSTEASAVKECLSPPSSFGYKDAFARRAIGGVTFQEFSRSDAGAGNYYEFMSYRAVRNGGCEVFEYVIHYSNIQNYPPESGIKEYNKQIVVDSLESILDTVKFTK